MTLRSFSLVAATALMASAAQAEPVTFLNGELTTKATLASDYVFRGFSQNDENITPMVTSVWAHESGLHVDLFAAPVDFAPGDDARAEIDLGVGYTHALTDKLTGDLSLVGYLYPGADSDADYDYLETIGTLGYDLGFGKATGLLAYSPEFIGGTGESVFVEAGLEAPLHVSGIEGLSVAGAVGRQMIEEADEYNTWRAGVTYAYKSLDFGVTYHDTNIGGSACSGLCDSRVVLSVGHKF